MNIIEPDIRCYDYETVVGGISDKIYPTRFSLSKNVSVKNQVVDGEEISACAGCAIATVAEYIWGEEFSEGWAYSKFRSDSYNEPGLYLSVALDIWRKIGIVPKADFDTLAEMPDIKNLVDKFPELLDIAKKFCIGGHADINYADKEKRDIAIKDALSKPKEIALIASSGTYFTGNHAFVIDGWDDGKGTYTYQNSYGKEFGDNGHGEIPKSKIDAVYAVFADNFILPFKDVDKTRWSFKHIQNMYMSGVIKGATADTFNPEGYITREEAAAMLDRHSEKDDETNRRIYKLIYEMFNMLKNLINKKR